MRKSVIYDVMDKAIVIWKILGESFSDTWALLFTRCTKRKNNILCNIAMLVKKADKI